MQYSAPYQKIPSAVFISGNGSNLNSIILNSLHPFYPIEVKCVISNKPNAGGLKIAQAFNIDTHLVQMGDFKDRKERDRKIDSILDSYNIELSCLAGFLSILDEEIVQKRFGRIINIHPSLLPSFKGMDAIQKALDFGIKTIGCTIHYVSPELDAGEIIAQSSVNIEHEFSAAYVSYKLNKIETKIFPKAIKEIAGNIIGIRPALVICYLKEMNVLNYQGEINENILQTLKDFGCNILLRNKLIPENTYNVINSIGDKSIKSDPILFALLKFFWEDNDKLFLL